MTFRMSILSDCKNKNGFSLVEVIAVLAILAIISMVIISQSGSFSTDVGSQADILRGHLRHAQALGMTGSDSIDVFGIKCDSSFYWMFKGNDPDLNIIMLPDDQRYNTNNDGKLGLAEKKIAIGTAFTVFFDERGIPYSAYTNEAVNTPYAADLLINVTPAGKAAPVETITVTQHTGFIP
jgi:prepilin-type N-terminal cleavage/methylation domain-containing protein